MSEEMQVAESAEPAAQSEEISDFRASLPEDLREHSALQPIQDVENLAKAYVNASSMIGRDKVVIPAENSSPYDWNEVYGRLGRPDEPAGYQLDAGEGADENMVGWFQQAAHDIGLNNTQAQKLVTSYNELIASQGGAEDQDLQAAYDETVKMLKGEWGASFDDKLSSAANAYAHFGGDDEFTELVLENGMRVGDHPVFLKAWADAADFITAKVSEDQFVGAEKTAGVMTPEEAKTKLVEIERPDGPLFDRAHPQHDHYVSERNRLYGYIYFDDDA